LTRSSPTRHKGYERVKDLTSLALADTRQFGGECRQRATALDVIAKFQI
jgi:hypothetical protein